MARKNVNILLKLEDQFTSKMVNAGKITEKQAKAMNRCSQSVMGFSRKVRSSFTSAVGHVAKFGAALAGIGGVLSIAGLKSFAAEAEELAKAQIEAETKLEAVLGNVQSLASQGPEAVKAAKEELVGVAQQLQKVGVIGDEVTLAGMQQLATFQLSTEEITTLSKGMTDLLAQQKGLNATQEDAVSYANLLGKAMSGNSGALTRVGIIMDDNQKKMLETGDATQRAAVLAEILEQNVGGVNEALADTDQGRLAQFAHQWGDMKEEVGKHILSLKANLAKNFAEYIPKIRDIAVAAVEKISALVNRAVEWAKAHSEQIKAALAGVRDRIVEVWQMIKPALTWLLQHAKTLIPIALKATAAIAGISVVADVAGKISGFVGAVKTAGTALKGVFRLIMTHPIIAVIAGIVAAVIYLWNHCEGFRNFVKKAFAVIVAAFEKIKTTAIKVKDGVVNAFTTLKTTVTAIFEAIRVKVKAVLDWIEKKIEAIKQAIEAIKQTWKDLTSGGWMSGVQENGYVSQSQLGNHATGTPYFSGGLTSINEGGRGEIVNLPSGTQIIPHDVSKNATGDTIINLNFTVAGNVIGNRAFMEETGRYVTERVKAALATV